MIRHGDDSPHLFVVAPTEGASELAAALRVSDSLGSWVVHTSWQAHLVASGVSPRHTPYTPEALEPFAEGLREKFGSPAQEAASLALFKTIATDLRDSNGGGAVFVANQYPGEITETMATAIGELAPTFPAGVYFAREVQGEYAYLTRPVEAGLPNSAVVGGNLRGITATAAVR